ncbi:MAG: peptide deformylase [Oscillospiraceae bacterium]|nr:peptide deformylase [Oscillospiraceae bacterium]
MIKEILKLGNPELYDISTEIQPEDLANLSTWVTDLHDTLLEYRRTYGAGRAIAAPQIGIKKRLLYMLTDREYVFINPSLSFPDDEMMEVLDDCMSFPGLCVKVMRHRRAVISYTDEQGTKQRMELEGDLSELLQHEYDHLDGILATMRAKDNRSLILMQMKR